MRFMIIKGKVIHTTKTHQDMCRFMKVQKKITNNFDIFNILICTGAPWPTRQTVRGIGNGVSCDQDLPRRVGESLFTGWEPPRCRRDGTPRGPMSVPITWSRRHQSSLSSFVHRLDPGRTGGGSVRPTGRKHWEVPNTVWTRRVKWTNVKKECWDKLQKEGSRQSTTKPVGCTDSFRTICSSLTWNGNVLRHNKETPRRGRRVKVHFFLSYFLRKDK